ncbi:serine/threonine-protein kinase [Chondromyces apiculatus]|nr:serine/threonine-protein kinase [Chondromyces apiculatus]
MLRPIGGGGMGSVYEARHRGTGRRVAVKVLSGSFLRNESVLTRFQREAKAAGSIQSQYITEVLDTGVDPTTGQPYIVMEHLDGEDLGQALHRVKVLSPDTALRIAAQTTLGLSRAHEARVIHRDIKPGNLFLARRESGELTLKICDFGVAKIVADRLQDIEKSGLTQTGSVLGSPLYMSPEQARGNKDIDPRSDLWSLGIVLYQMLSGRRPHEDIDALGELIIAICSEPPRPLQDVAPWVPPEVAAVVHGALHFEPARRFQSAAEMLEAMRPLLQNGWSLDASMILPISEGERLVVAPRLDLTAAEAAMQGATPAISLDGQRSPFASGPDFRGSNANLEPTIAEAPLTDLIRTPGSPSALSAPAAVPGVERAPTGGRARAVLWLMLLLLAGLIVVLAVLLKSRG